MSVEPADLIAHGGRILTSARDAAFADAIAVCDGVVAAAGTSEDIRSYAGALTMTVDLGGRTLIPGLIDSHMHAVRAGLTWDREVRWDGVGSLAQALALLARAAEARPAGTWIAVLGGWHPGQFAEARVPTRDELDRVVPTKPVLVQLLYDGVVLNSAALALVGDIGADSVGWAPGMGAIQRCTSAMAAAEPAAELASTRAFFDELTRWGLTGVIDAGGFGMTRDRYRPLFGLAETGALPLRVRLYVGAANPGHEEQEVEDWLEHMRADPGDELLAAVGIGELVVFACHDGEGLEQRAFAPEALERLEAVTCRVADEGRPMQLHAILDSSVGAILDVWERVDRDRPIAGLRFCLAHVEQISGRNLERARALGVGLAVQNRLALRAADSAPLWGSDALRLAPPLRDFLAAGLPIAAGTDATRVTPPNPWHAIAWLVGGRPLDGGPHRDPRQCLSVLEALDAYTTGSAWMSREATERGRLLPGYRADFAVLDQDCFSLPPEGLPAVVSVLTVVGGRPVHAAAEFSGLTP